MTPVDGFASLVNYLGYGISLPDSWDLWSLLGYMAWQPDQCWGGLSMILYYQSNPGADIGRKKKKYDDNTL